MNLIIITITKETTRQRWRLRVRRQTKSTKITLRAQQMLKYFVQKFNLTYKLMQWCATKRATWKCVWPKQNVEPKMNLQSKHLLPCCCCCYCWYFCCCCASNWCCCCCGGHPLLQHVALSKLLRSKKLLRPLYKARQLIWSKWIKYNGNEH